MLVVMHVSTTAATAAFRAGDKMSVQARVDLVDRFPVAWGLPRG